MKLTARIASMGSAPGLVHFRVEVTDHGFVKQTQSISVVIPIDEVTIEKVKEVTIKEYTDLISVEHHRQAKKLAEEYLQQTFEFEIKEESED